MNFNISAEKIRVITALLPVLDGTDWWVRRVEVAWYVGRCMAAGFCETDEQMRLCAKRFMAGKRRVTPPGTQRRKDAEKAKRKLLASMPSELDAAIVEAMESNAARQFADGNDKALNSVVGMVLMKYKADPAFIRGVLIERLKK